MSDPLLPNKASEAARGALIRMGPSKHRMVCAFETFVFPAVWVIEHVRPQREPPNESIREILVIEYWNIGDIVNLLPFLESLRAAYPAARVSLLINPAMRSAFESRSLADEVIPFTTLWSTHFNRWQKYNPFSLRWFQLAKTLMALRRRKFDLALTGRMDIRDNFLAWLIDARRRVGYGFAGGGFFLTDVVTPDLNRPHRSQIWLQLLRHLGKNICSEIPRLRLVESEKAAAAGFLRKNGIGDGELLVGVHPGARVPTRRWGEANFAAVATRIESEFKARILWFADPAETYSSDCISPSWIRVALPFREFLAVLARCQMLICNDSGPMHLSTALGVPVVAVFGPTQPVWFGPVGPGNRVVIRPEFWCRPCFDYCIFNEPYCLRTITVEEVFKTATESLREVIQEIDLKTAHRPRRIGTETRS